MSDSEDRCRLVLVPPETQDVERLVGQVGDALRGGDVATIILPQHGMPDHHFQAIAERIVPLAQKADVAVIIAGDSRIVGRSQADGVHIEGGVGDLADAMERYSPRLIVGTGGIKDRHSAMERGEKRPDYVFFGKLDGDIKPEAHPKMLALAEWWAAIVEIPCIVMGGSDPASAVAVAATGADFVAMGSAVFDNPAGTAQAVAEINALLDENAPRLGA